MNESAPNYKFNDPGVADLILKEDFQERMSNGVFLQKLLESAMEDFPELEFPEFRHAQGRYSDFHVALMQLSMHPDCPSVKSLTRTFFSAATHPEGPQQETRRLVNWVMHSTPTPKKA